MLTHPTLAGEAVEVGLWDPSLSARSGRTLATITAPDGTTATAMRQDYGATWLSLHYPADFPGARSTELGAYTIVWETRGLTICDGFEVSAPLAGLEGLPWRQATEGAKAPGPTREALLG